jgi:phage I-like protein
MYIAACTTLPITSPAKMFRLLPAGHFRASDGRPKEVASWFLDGAIAAKLIRAATAQNVDFVIDYEHQTLQAAQNGKPAPAAGWFHKLEWRDGDGLYVTDARWTDAAEKMLTAQEYRYISPVFQYDSKTGDVEKLVNAALTNNPALDGLTDLAAATRRHNSLDVERSAEIEHANDVLLRTFGSGAATVSSAAARSSRVDRNDGGGVFGRMQEDEIEQTNAKLRELFGPNAAQVKQMPKR